MGERGKVKGGGQECLVAAIVNENLVLLRSQIFARERDARLSVMRKDILPLCDKHYRTMEFCLAPLTASHSVEYFRCTEKFCPRCFSESLGYVTPIRDDEPILTREQPRCERHGRPMMISGLDRQRNVLRYACPEDGCGESLVK